MDRETLRKLIIVIIIGITVSWLAYAYYYKPKLQDISQLRKNLQMIEKEFTAFAPDEKILKKGKMVDLIKEEVIKTEEKLPSEENIISVIEKIIGQKGIDYIFVEPQNVVSEEKYKRLPLKLRFSCSFSDFDVFLQRLENLPMIVRIDAFSAFREENKDSLELSVTLSIFLSPSQPSEKKAISLKTHRSTRDPFYPEVSKIKTETYKVQAEIPKLSGIWYGKITKAFINNQAVSVGEYINGYKVSSISKDKVILTKGGKEYILKKEVK